MLAVLLLLLFFFFSEMKFSIYLNRRVFIMDILGRFSDIFYNSRQLL